MHLQTAHTIYMSASSKISSNIFIADFNPIQWLSWANLWKFCKNYCWKNLPSCVLAMPSIFILWKSDYVAGAFSVRFWQRSFFLFYTSRTIGSLHYICVTVVGERNLPASIAAQNYLNFSDVFSLNMDILNWKDYAWLNLGKNCPLISKRNWEIEFCCSQCERCLIVVTHLSYVLHIETYRCIAINFIAIEAIGHSFRFENLTSKHTIKMVSYENW